MFYKERLSLQLACVTIADFTKDKLLLFYDWLETERGNSIATRNHRKTIISDFASWLVEEHPESAASLLAIADISSKKAPKHNVSYTSVDGMSLIIAKVQNMTADGFRDKLVLLVLFITGVRVSELINIRISDVEFSSPKPRILIHGKGGKERYVTSQRSFQT